MLLNEQQSLIRETARDFAQERLAPFAAEWDRESRFPAEALREMAALGILGMTVPEAWEGAGADTVSYAAALIEVGAGDGSCSTIMSVHNSVGCQPVVRFGSDESKRRFLKPSARWGALSASCHTDREAGSDWAAITSRARREGNKWVLNRTK